MNRLETDVCIVGAGPSGSSAAYFLGKAGIQTLIVDRATFPRDKICGDALSGKSMDVLKKMNPDVLEDLLSDDRFIGSFGVHFISPNEKCLSVPFSSSKLDVPPGLIGKRIDFDDFLLKKALQFQSVQLRESCFINKIDHKTDEVLLYDQRAELQISCKTVLICYGAQQHWADELFGFRIQEDELSYGLRAYMKGIDYTDEGNFIEMHFTQNLLPGYCWIFPMSHCYYNVGIGMPAKSLKRKQTDLKRLFDDLIQNSYLKNRFKNAEQIGGVKLHALPTSGLRKKDISVSRALLCGDAAGLIDPFTGEGIGQALKSGMLAAEACIIAINRNDYSAASFKLNYDQKVYKHLWKELQMSRRILQLVKVPGLFNLIANRAQKSQLVNSTFANLFENIEVRKNFSDPSFYLKILMGK